MTRLLNIVIGGVRLLSFRVLVAGCGLAMMWSGLSGLSQEWARIIVGSVLFLWVLIGELRG